MSYFKRLRISPSQLALSMVLAALAIYFGFDAGTVTETHRVTVTHVVDHPVHVPATSGGPRIGGLPARTQWEYWVMCTTIHGQPCFVVTEEHVRYQHGQLITAEVELHKPAGVFGWTFTCRLFAWLSLSVLAWGLWKGRQSRDVPEAAPPSKIGRT